MGMFDEIRSNYSGLEGNFQTKDLDNLMLKFYLDPAGGLWNIDYSGTHKIDFDPTAPLTSSVYLPFSFSSTGFNGRVSGAYVTKYITVTDGDREFRLHFVEGVLQSFE